MLKKKKTWSWPRKLKVILDRYLWPWEAVIERKGDVKHPLVGLVCVHSHTLTQQPQWQWSTAGLVWHYLIAWALPFSLRPRTEALRASASHYPANYDQKKTRTAHQRTSALFLSFLKTKLNRLISRISLSWILNRVGFLGSRAQLPLSRHKAVSPWKPERKAQNLCGVKQKCTWPHRRCTGGLRVSLQWKRSAGSCRLVLVNSDKYTFCVAKPETSKGNLLPLV